jgi:hypothetical protein
MARLFSLRTLAFTGLCACTLSSCSWINGVSDWANKTMPTYDSMYGDKDKTQAVTQQPRRGANDAYGTSPSSMPPAQPAYNPSPAYGQPPQAGGVPPGYPSNIPSAPPGYGEEEAIPGAPGQAPQYGGQPPAMPAPPPWPGQ